MEPVEQLHKDNFIIELMRGTQKEDLNYIYRGEFSQNISSQILSLAEKNIDRLGMSSKIKKRVFHIMVESIQNITRHQEAPIELQEESAIFAIQKRNYSYFITTGNLIENDKIPSLNEKLQKVNSLTQDELNSFYREILSNGKLSAKGGAGLGLIEMARKSGNKLSYAFRPINNELSYFYLNSHINTLSTEGSPEDDILSEKSLNILKNIHHFINHNNIILIYSSVFDQDSLLSLISILDNQVSEKIAFKKKMISVMVEMLQNIIHHGEVETKEIFGSQGIFYISRLHEEYVLNSTNYVLNEKQPVLKKKLEYVNSLSPDDLEDYYNKQLFNFQINTAKEAGLGIIEMKLKSKKPLQYRFEKFDDTYSFFTLQVALEKK